MDNVILYFYDPDTVVRKALFSDIAQIAADVRRADAEEIWCAEHKTAEQALATGLDISTYCRTIVRKGVAVAMFGVAPAKDFPETAVVWLIGANGINGMKKQFVGISKIFIAALLDMYPFLFNLIDSRNTSSVAWLKKLGAEMLAPIPYGVEKLLFIPFRFRRPNV